MKQIWVSVCYLAFASILLFQSQLFCDNANNDTLTEAKKHYSFAVQQKNAGNVNEARRQFEKSLAVYDGMYQVHYAYGDLLEQEGEKEEAIRVFKRVLELKPDYYNAAARLANLYNEIGDYKAAIDMYNLMYSLKPENRVLLATIANIKDYLGDGEGAYTDFVQLIESGESTYNNLMKAAEISFRKENYKSACQYAMMALDKKPDDHRALEITGKSSMLMENQESAVKYYRRLAEIDSTSIEIITIVENLYRSLSDRQNLIWALKRHYEIEPNNVSVLGELCENFYPDGLTEGGIEYVKEGIRLAPEDGRFHILMGENYHTLGQQSNALEEYRKALKDARWNSTAQRLIWQIEKPETEERKAERDFFKRGKE